MCSSILPTVNEQGMFRIYRCRLLDNETIGRIQTRQVKQDIQINYTCTGFVIKAVTDPFDTELKEKAQERDDSYALIEKFLFTGVIYNQKRQKIRNNNTAIKFCMQAFYLIFFIILHSYSYNSLNYIIKNPNRKWELL